MSALLEQRLNRLSAVAEPLFRGAKIGLEKESLRVGLDGMIAQTAHPERLGAALTHPHITTDYSEALLEFITPPLTNTTDVLSFLHDIHHFVYQQLDDELLWAASMPCVVDGETSVPIARYGSSNLGFMKHVYRRGLGYRYGKVMQVIAGIHFNYSLPDTFWAQYQEHEQATLSQQAFISDAYFGLIRNVQRYSWLLLYLFGCSPALCKSFLHGQSQSQEAIARLQEYDDSSYFLPYATSLRMSDIGYTNKARCGLKVRYDSPQTYCADLLSAISSKCLPYQAIGVKVNGNYQQLNANILQIENEYYSIMRPKQPPQASETPLQALHKRGVQYVELRSSDLGLFDPAGLNEIQLRFLEAFLIFCLLQDSPPIDQTEQTRIDNNQVETAARGRDPALRLQRGQNEMDLASWGQEICDDMIGICELLDQGCQNNADENAYSAALQRQRDALSDPALTPSAQLLIEMQTSKLGFFHYAQQISEQHRDYFRSAQLAASQQQYFAEWVSQSLRQQQQLEANDKESFDDYLQHYFANAQHMDVKQP